MFELFIELLAELFGNLLLEWAFGNISLPRVTRGGLLSLLVSASGCLLGWVSTALLARPLIPWTAWRVAYVIAVPPLIATAVVYLTERRVEKGKRPGLIGNWADAYFFALGFSLTRFCATF